jgi:hypothetical protein
MLLFENYQCFELSPLALLDVMKEGIFTIE